MLAACRREFSRWRSTSELAPARALPRCSPLAGESSHAGVPRRAPRRTAKMLAACRREFSRWRSTSSTRALPRCSPLAGESSHAGVPRRDQAACQDARRLPARVLTLAFHATRPRLSRFVACSPISQIGLSGSDRRTFHVRSWLPEPSAIHVKQRGSELTCHESLRLVQKGKDQFKWDR